MRSYRTRQFWFAATVVVAVLAPATPAATLSVCADGSGDHATIQAAIDAAVDGDEVVVCSGTYSGPGNIDLDLGGKAITVRSSDGPDATVIDCEQLGRGFIFQSQETNASVVDGFTIVNGQALELIRSGGAILCVYSAPTIRNCVITGNECAFEGGGIHSELIDGLRLINCVIADNTAQTAGGLSVIEGSASVVNCEITGNSAIVVGGGVFSFLSDLTATNCTVSGNTLSFGSYGSAVYAMSGSLSITSSILWDNPLPSTSIRQIIAFGTTISVAYSDVEGGRQAITAFGGVFNWLEGNIDVDPMFEAAATPQAALLAAPAGEPTVIDYRLRLDSPCVDAGDNTIFPSDVDTDARGRARFIDDPDTSDTGLGSAPIIDMGAYELQVETERQIAMDIRPGSCVNPINPKSRGMLPIALLGAIDLDVTQIDVTTLVVSGEGEGASVPAARAALEDVASPVEGEFCDWAGTRPDGIIDLVVKVSMRDLVPALGLDELDTDESVTLVMTGQLIDGTSFTASDSVRIVKKRTRDKKK